MRSPAPILLAAALAVGAGSARAQNEHVIHRNPLRTLIDGLDTNTRPVKGPSAFDVHILKLTTVSPSFVPTAEVVAAKRLTPGGTANESSLRVDVGGARFTVQAYDDGHGGVSLHRESGKWMSQSGPNSTTVDVSDPWRWGRRPRHGTTVRGVLLCEPVADATKPFAPLDSRGFVQHLIAPMLGPDARPTEENSIEHEFNDWIGPRAMAARVLGSVPLRDYLEPGQIDQILAAAGKLRIEQGDRFWQLVRPLIALGHRPTLERLALQAAEQDNGPHNGPHGIHGGRGDSGIRTPWIPRSVEDSILIAYSTATDPPTRGLAGWIATGTRSNDVYDQLLADLESGRAVLPGDAAQREALGSHLVHARAWQSTAAPLLTLAASALAIAAAMFVLRLALRRML